MNTCKDCFFYHSDKDRELSMATKADIDALFVIDGRQVPWGRCYCYPPSPNCGRTGVLQRSPVREDEPQCYRFHPADGGLRIAKDTIKNFAELDKESR